MADGRCPGKTWGWFDGSLFHDSFNLRSPFLSCFAFYPFSPVLFLSLSLVSSLSSFLLVECLVSCLLSFCLSASCLSSFAHLSIILSDPQPLVNAHHAFPSSHLKSPSIPNPRRKRKENLKEKEKPIRSPASRPPDPHPGTHSPSFRNPSHPISCQCHHSPLSCLTISIRLPRRSLPRSLHLATSSCLAIM